MEFRYNKSNYLKLPNVGFTFKPAEVKPKRIPSTHKPLTKILYCLAKKDNNGEWKAYINTKGIPDYKDLTILPFTEKSFELKGRNEVFRVSKDKYNHYVKVIRTDVEAEFYPGNKEDYCTLCENHVYSGHIVKVDGITQFDMSICQGHIKQCDVLLTMTNKIKKNEEEL